MLNFSEFEIFAEKGYLNPGKKCLILVGEGDKIKYQKAHASRWRTPMEKNDFLLYNEIIYRIHACRTLEEFRPTLLAQVKLIIPYTYASLIATRPTRRRGAHPPGPLLQATELPGGGKRLAGTHRQGLHRLAQPRTGVHGRAGQRDLVRRQALLRRQLPGAVHGLPRPRLHADEHHLRRQAMGRLALYRTRGDGLFTDQEAFYLRALANHIDLACWTCKQNEDNQPKQTRSLEEIIRTYDLTRREGEVLGLVFQDWNNEEILAKLTISKNTLLKHLQNLYRKCGCPPDGTC